MAGQLERCLSALSLPLSSVSSRVNCHRRSSSAPTPNRTEKDRVQLLMGRASDAGENLTLYLDFATLPARRVAAIRGDGERWPDRGASGNARVMFVCLRCLSGWGCMPV